MTIGAMKLALEALGNAEAEGNCEYGATALLRAAIEQAEKQEPFGYFQYAPHFDAWVQNRDSSEGVPFYTAPRQWVGLADDEIKEIIGPWGETPIKGYTRKLFDQIEAKLKEKNR